MEDRRQRLRRSMMFVPGNSPSMLQNAFIYGADSVVFDLEDSVSAQEKDAARLLVHNAIQSLDKGGAEVVVRINPLSSGIWEQDIEAMVCAGADAIRLPKTEAADDIRCIMQVIDEMEQKHGVPSGRTGIFAAIESAKGVMNALSIAGASPRLLGISIGGEDYAADLQTSRSKEGTELFYARGQILNAARAFQVAAIDTVFADVMDDEGFLKETRLIKAMGFDGKSIINPRQVDLAHAVFAPSEGEIDAALRVMEAIKEAESRGSGVISLDGKMIDRPVVLRAQRVLKIAARLGLKREVTQ